MEEIKIVCDACTWRNNHDACAMAPEDGPLCPGFQEEPCECCELNPCICEPYQEEESEDW